MGEQWPSLPKWERIGCHHPNGREMHMLYNMKVVTPLHLGGGSQFPPILVETITPLPFWWRWTCPSHLLEVAITLSLCIYTYLYIEIVSNICYMLVNTIYVLKCKYSYGAHIYIYHIVAVYIYI